MTTKKHHHHHHHHRHHHDRIVHVTVLENLEVIQLAKKLPAFMELNAHYHAPKSATLLDPILKQFSPSYSFMRSHLKSHFQTILTLCINLQSSPYA